MVIDTFVYLTQFEDIFLGKLSGEEISLAHDGEKFYFDPTEKILMVNSMGASDSYNAGFKIKRQQKSFNHFYHIK